jgi:hypothetical protein
MAAVRRRLTPARLPILPTPSSAGHSTLRRRRMPICWTCHVHAAGASDSRLRELGRSEVQLVINLKTAKALGLTIAQSVLVRADEVIQ